MPGTKIFKAGKYPQGNFSIDDVKKIAENYNPQFSEAPITLDHIQAGPAFGWVKTLSADDKGVLTAEFKDMAPEFKEAVKEKKYKNRSVEIYRDLEGKGPYLKAVTFLGAIAPQVKGLGEVAFKEGEADVLEFEEQEDGGNNAEIAEFQNKIKILSSKVATLEEKSKTDADKFADDLQAEQQKVTDAQNKLNGLYMNSRKLDFETFLTEKIAYGQITPAQSDLALKLIAALNAVPQFAQFSEDGKCESFGEVADLFKQIIELAPKNEALFHDTTNQKDAKGGNAEMKAVDIAQAAQAYMSEQSKNGNIISYTAAVTHVIQPNK